MRWEEISVFSSIQETLSKLNHTKTDHSHLVKEINSLSWCTVHGDGIPWVKTGANVQLASTSRRGLAMEFVGYERSNYGFKVG